MSQRGSKARKSLSGENRTVASPGVITRSQLKQLANAKSVPEEYKHVVEENQSISSPRKQGKSPGNKKQSTPRRVSVLAKGRRASKKTSENNIEHNSHEQNDTLEVEANLIAKVEHADDSYIANNITNTSKLTGKSKEILKKKRKGEGRVVDSDGSVKNDGSVNSKCDMSCSLQDDHDGSSQGQLSNKMEISEGEICDTEELVALVSPATSSEQNNSEQERELDLVHSRSVRIGAINKKDGGSRCHSVKKSLSKSNALPSKKTVVGKKTGRNNKLCSTLERGILNKCQSKAKENAPLERNNSVCEPVDMSISEDSSEIEKKDSVHSSASDTEVSGLLLEINKKSVEELANTKGKPKLLKKEKHSDNQEAPKSSEVSSITSSSYNSGYEITPSKTQPVAKERSLSTKTTDSGITGMVDSNPYGDSDSSTSDKQQSHDTTQNLNLMNHSECRTKDRQDSIPKNNPIVNHLGVTTKVINSLPNECVPSGSGSTLEARQPFLIRMKPTINEDTVDSDSDAESRKAIMLSAQRRIEQNLSTTDSEGRRYTTHQTPSSSLHDMEDSDDAPPDSMTFEAGRNTATESLRDAVESIRRDRQRRKEKRRARLEKLRQQKEEKLIRLKERLASQEDASCSSSEESGYEDEEVRQYKKKPVSRDKSKTEKEGYDRTTKFKKKSSSIQGRVTKLKVEDDNKMDQALISSSSSLPKRLPDELLERLSEKPSVLTKAANLEKANEKGLNNGTMSIQKKRKKAALPSSEQSDAPSDSQSFKKPSNLDYIPLKTTSSTKFGIMSYDKVLNVSKSAAQKAAEFRQNMMFGNRHKREPATTSMIYQQKLKASGKDVFARKKY